MRDLRRRALEGNKTVSKKAKSRMSSRTSSRPNSQPTSTNVSRHGSEDEAEMGDLSDGTNWSNFSIDDGSFEDVDEDDLPENWELELKDIIEEIMDRKRSSVQGREMALNRYIFTLQRYYARSEIQPRADALISALLKSIKVESGEEESILALRAIEITLLTCPSDIAYDEISPILNRIYVHSEFIRVKVAAIHSFSTVLVYGGASEYEIEAIMDDFLEVIESDGNSANAPDSGEVVSAAAQAWGVLATHIEDVESKTAMAIDVFVEQLESTDTSVLIAVGQIVALLYEKSYTSREPDDAPVDKKQYAESGLDPSFVKRYDVYRNKYEVEQTLSGLAKISSKRFAKTDRKILRQKFSDILSSVEVPTRGPGYQKTIDQETGQMSGSKMTVRIHRTGAVKIDKWWKLYRLFMLRRVLGTGFVDHFEANNVVFESLPVAIIER